MRNIVIGYNPYCIQLSEFDIRRKPRLELAGTKKKPSLALAGTKKAILKICPQTLILCYLHNLYTNHKMRNKRSYDAC